MVIVIARTAPILLLKKMINDIYWAKTFIWFLFLSYSYYLVPEYRLLTLSSIKVIVITSKEWMVLHFCLERKAINFLVCRVNPPGGKSNLEYELWSCFRKSLTLHLPSDKWQNSSLIVLFRGYIWGLMATILPAVARANQCRKICAMLALQNNIDVHQ